jgi:uncharacterized peroxidase-related enzyme
MEKRMLKCCCKIHYGDVMAHIDLGIDETRFPGITGLLQYRPETAKPLGELAEVLLRGPHSLSAGERELIAAYVSGLNECRFCSASHSAFAAAQLTAARLGTEAAADPAAVAADADLVQQVRTDPETAPIPAKLRRLLRIAAAVRHDGRTVTAQMVQDARAEGATDLEIHDTVLIAAAFSMYNRYVDGLGTLAPEDPQAYLASARRIVEVGYAHALAPHSSLQS